MLSPSGLDRAGIVAAYVFLGLIVALIAGSLTGLTMGVDLGVFGTLVGGLLALLGRGAVIRLFGRNK